jgi:hypothetical protein
LQYYLEARKHSQEFRRAAAEGIDKLGGSAQADIIAKHFQIVKLELEAVLKLEKWEELDDLFDQCWKYKSPDHYETLADLVLVIHSCIALANVDDKYQKSELTGHTTCMHHTNERFRSTVCTPQDHQSDRTPGGNRPHEACAMAAMPLQPFARARREH